MLSGMLSALADVAVAWCSNNYRKKPMDYTLSWFLGGFQVSQKKY